MPSDTAEGPEQDKTSNAQHSSMVMDLFRKIQTHTMSKITNSGTTMSKGPSIDPTTTEPSSSVMNQLSVVANVQSPPDRSSIFDMKKREELHQEALLPGPMKNESPPIPTTVFPDHSCKDQPSTSLKSFTPASERLLPCTSVESGLHDSKNVTATNIFSKSTTIPALEQPLDSDCNQIDGMGTNIVKSEKIGPPQAAAEVTDYPRSLSPYSFGGSLSDEEQFVTASEGEVDFENFYTGTFKNRTIKPFESQDQNSDIPRLHEGKTDKIPIDNSEHPEIFLPDFPNTSSFGTENPTEFHSYARMFHLSGSGHQVVKDANEKDQDISRSVPNVLDSPLENEGSMSSHRVSLFSKNQNHCETDSERCGNPTQSVPITEKFSFETELPIQNLEENPMEKPSKKKTSNMEECSGEMVAVTKPVIRDQSTPSKTRIIATSCGESSMVGKSTSTPISKSLLQRSQSEIVSTVPESIVINRLVKSQPETALNPRTVSQLNSTKSTDTLAKTSLHSAYSTTKIEKEVSLASAPEMTDIGGDSSMNNQTEKTLLPEVLPHLESDHNYVKQVETSSQVLSEAKKDSTTSNFSLKSSIKTVPPPVKLTLSNPLSSILKIPIFSMKGPTKMPDASSTPTLTYFTHCAKVAKSANVITEVSSCVVPEMGVAKSAGEIAQASSGTVPEIEVAEPAEVIAEASSGIVPEKGVAKSAEEVAKVSTGIVPQMKTFASNLSADSSTCKNIVNISSEVSFATTKAIDLASQDLVKLKDIITNISKTSNVSGNKCATSFELQKSGHDEFLSKPSNSFVNTPVKEEHLLTEVHTKSHELGSEVKVKGQETDNSILSKAPNTLKITPTNEECLLTEVHSTKSRELGSEVKVQDPETNNSILSKAPNTLNITSINEEHLSSEMHSTNHKLGSEVKVQGRETDNSKIKPSSLDTGRVQVNKSHALIASTATTSHKKGYETGPSEVKVREPVLKVKSPRIEEPDDSDDDVIFVSETKPVKRSSRGVKGQAKHDFQIKKSEKSKERLTVITRKSDDGSTRERAASKLKTFLKSTVKFTQKCQNYDSVNNDAPKRARTNDILQKKRVAKAKATLESSQNQQLSESQSQVKLQPKGQKFDLADTVGPERGHTNDKSPSKTTVMQSSKSQSERDSVNTNRNIPKNRTPKDTPSLADDETSNQHNLKMTAIQNPEKGTTTSNSDCITIKIKSKRKSTPMKCDFSSKKPRIFLTQKQIRKLPLHMLKPVLLNMNTDSNNCCMKIVHSPEEKQNLAGICDSEKSENVKKCVSLPSTPEKQAKKPENLGGRSLVVERNEKLDESDNLEQCMLLKSAPEKQVGPQTSEISAEKPKNLRGQSEAMERMISENQQNCEKGNEKLQKSENWEQCTSLTFTAEKHKNFLCPQTNEFNAEKPENVISQDQQNCEKGDEKLVGTSVLIEKKAHQSTHSSAKQEIDPKITCNSSRSSENIEGMTTGHSGHDLSPISSIISLADQAVKCFPTSVDSEEKKSSTYTSTVNDKSEKRIDDGGIGPKDTNTGYPGGSPPEENSITVSSPSRESVSSIQITKVWTKTDNSDAYTPSTVEDTASVSSISTVNCDQFEELNEDVVRTPAKSFDSSTASFHEEPKYCLKTIEVQTVKISSLHEESGTDTERSPVQPAKTVEIPYLSGEVGTHTARSPTREITCLSGEDGTNTARSPTRLVHSAKPCLPGEDGVDTTRPCSGLAHHGEPSISCSKAHDEKSAGGRTSPVTTFDHSLNKTDKIPNAEQSNKVKTSASVVIEKLQPKEFLKGFSIPMDTREALKLAGISSQSRLVVNTAKKHSRKRVFTYKKRVRKSNSASKIKDGTPPEAHGNAVLENNFSEATKLKNRQKVLISSKRGKATESENAKNSDVTSLKRPRIVVDIERMASCSDGGLSRTKRPTFRYAPKIEDIIMTFDPRVTTCCFCHLPANHLLGLGDLFGPYRPLAEEVLSRQDAVNEHLKGNSSGTTTTDDPAHAAVGSPQVTFDTDEGTCFLTARVEEDQLAVHGSTVKDITQAISKSSHHLRTLSTIDHVLQDAGNLSWQNKQKLINGLTGSQVVRIPGPQNECKILSSEKGKNSTPSIKDGVLRVQNDGILPNINAIVFLEPKIELPHTGGEPEGIISPPRSPLTPGQRSPRSADSNSRPRRKSLNSGRSGSHVTIPRSPLPETSRELSGDSTSVCISHKFNTGPLWTHGYCALWADGVYAIRGVLYSLWDAARTSGQIFCTLCNRPGACIVTFEDKLAFKTRGVPLKAYHYPCALCANLKLNWETLTANNR